MPPRYTLNNYDVVVMAPIRVRVAARTQDEASKVACRRVKSRVQSEVYTHSTKRLDRDS